MHKPQGGGTGEELLGRFGFGCDDGDNGGGAHSHYAPIRGRGCL